MKNKTLKRTGNSPINKSKDKFDELYLEAHRLDLLEHDVFELISDKCHELDCTQQPILEFCIKLLEGLIEDYEERNQPQQMVYDYEPYGDTFVKREIEY